MPKPKTSGNLALSGFDDIFKPTTVSYVQAEGKSVVEIPIAELHPPEFHPFQVNDDASMTRLVESIKRYGIK